jgi:hypothetical protein
MTYVAPSTVVAGQTYSAANHNIIVNDIIDHEDRLDTVQNAQYPARNVLVNGAMQFAQRATSVTGMTSGGFVQTADRWVIAIVNAGTWTSAVSADAPTGSGFRNSLRMTCSASGNVGASGFAFIVQKLEGQTLQHIKKGTASAQPLTLSFWAKGSTTGTYICQLYDNDNARSVSGSYTISAADTWEQKTITFPADTTGAFDNDNASSLEFQMYLSAGTDRTSGTLATVWGSSVSANNAVGQTNLSAAASRYLAVTGVQLEPGSQASPFEFVRYDDELKRCQRYYEKSFAFDQPPVDNPSNKRGALHGRAWVTGNYTNFPSVKFSVEKRATPTIAFFNPQSTTAGRCADVNSPFTAYPMTSSIGGAGATETTTGFSCVVNNSSVPSVADLSVHWTASAEL